MTNNGMLIFISVGGTTSRFTIKYWARQLELVALKLKYSVVGTYKSYPPHYGGSKDKLIQM
jgi:hypothetical protein